MNRPERKRRAARLASAVWPLPEPGARRGVSEQARRRVIYAIIPAVFAFGKFREDWAAPAQ